ncbi:MAG: GntR family transcriptional regulator [Acetobacteraceae bacterium]|nr:GntR family transcriptional regulator [Acetobacteraceae bacterium]
MRALQSPPTRVEQVYDEILAAITDGKLPPHTRLIQDDLASQLGVSRQPVQQALLLLRNDGLARDAPGRGLIVAPFDAEAARNVYEVRAALEGLASRLAAERGSARAAGARAAVIENGRAAVASGSVSRMVAADLKFHNLIYELSGNTLIKETAEPHWRQMRRTMGEVLMLDDTPSRIWTEHEAILSAVIAGDAAKAEDLGRCHISDAAEGLLAKIYSKEMPQPDTQQGRIGRRA